MSNRLIFPNLGLIKREAVDRFLVATQEIYKKHPVYTYHDEQEATKIFIYPTYGNIEQSGKEPKLLVKAGGYNYSLMDSLYRNMSNEYINASGLVAGYEHFKVIPMPINVTVQAYAEEESSDIADELAALIGFAVKGMYAQVGMAVRGVTVSETNKVNPNEDLYQTTISVAFDMPWETRFETLEPPIDGIGVEIEDPLSFTTYRQPGANVAVQKD